MNNSSSGFSHSALAFLAVILAAILSGGTPAFTKIGVGEFQPFTFIFIRFVLSIIFFIPLIVRAVRKYGKELFPVVILSLLSTANIILFTLGVKRTTATVSQMIYAVVPISSAVFSAWLLKENISRQKIGGIVLGLLGMGLIVLLPVVNQMSRFSGDLTGNLMIVVGAISFSIYSVLSKRLQKKFSPIVLTGIFLLTTAIVSGMLSLTETTNYFELWNDVTLRAWISLAYVASLGTAVFYYLYQYAIKHGSPVIASTTLYLAPATAFAWAFVLLGERLTMTFGIGAIVTLTGAWLVTRSHRVQSR
ncbi:MAG: hypothetical protein A2785_00785 [Candidatus Chisholmbacteria bacterium RIFCSPHIGHO2_01_FULL_49_18]|uniref:EamA domain-containing protein n=2 Tax=Candidatus Chisholmiibacteriota TaxID=1817900 RepID=A0A1G1VLJ0_9BACT|nr:MAG: hypothetical protein A2785_00785 [Candidatus Chisholmbacteria bacterium RIFCSPHIGHO2_01_FULL_49_18]OGY22205.1 MAG: hypothetical protein A3A65_04915 [Candidatus Chisholmbacteria bacterium RIFCSPLOWO2_01_FULL_49_14]